MVTQLTVRSVSVRDMDVLKHEASSRGVSLNSLIRTAIGEQADLIRRREALRAIMGDVDARRDRIAKRVGGTVPDSVELIREDRGR